jgi:hypothetical protein
MEPTSESIIKGTADHREGYYLREDIQLYPAPR